MAEKVEYEFDEIDEEMEYEFDEETELICKQRMNYKKTKCDGAAWVIEEDGLFHLMEYKDRKKQLFYVKLNTESVRVLRDWCDKYLNGKEEMLVGYQ